MAKSLIRRGLPRLPCLFCFHSAIAYSPIQRVREPRLIRALLYCFQLVVLCRGLGMRIRRLMGVDDQIVAS